MIARLFDIAWTSLTRNSLLSLGAVSVVFLVSFLLFLLSSGNVLLERSVEELSQNVEFTVFLKKGVSVDNALVRELSTGLGLLGTEVTLMTSEEALAMMKETTSVPELVEQTAALVESYQGEALLEPVMIIRNVANVAPERIEGLLRDRKFEQTIDFTYFDEQFSRVQNLSAVTTSARVVFWTLQIIFLAVASLILFNTIRILLFTRRDEIQIMQLVGADRLMIQGPFYLEASLLALGGVIVAFIVFLLLLLQWQGLIRGLFGETLGTQNVLLTVGETLTRHMGGYALLELGNVLLLLVIVALASTWYALRTHMPKLS